MGRLPLKFSILNKSDLHFNKDIFHLNNGTRLRRIAFKANTQNKSWFIPSLLLDTMVTIFWERTKNTWVEKKSLFVLFWLGTTFFVSFHINCFLIQRVRRDGIPIKKTFFAWRLIHHWPEIECNHGEKDDKK